MKIDPNELRSQAGKLNSVGDELQTKLAGALRALEGLGDFCSNDKFGDTFNRGVDGKPGYSSFVQTATADANAIINGYHDIAGLPHSHRGAGGLSQMANNVDVANWNTIVTLPKIPQK